MSMMVKPGQDKFTIYGLSFPEVGRQDTSIFSEVKIKAMLHQNPPDGTHRYA